MSFDVVIVAAKRTPMGAFQGALSKVTAPKLGSVAIEGALEAASLAGEQVQEVYMGCVLAAGLGQAPARQASIHGGIPESVPSTTINKVCGSGLKAIMLGCDQIRLGHSEVVVAGGMESMTNAPYLLDRARAGYRLGHGKVLDHMYLDGLEDAYQQGKYMGCFAEETADKYQFSREEQDAFACESVVRAQKARDQDWSATEIVPVPLLRGDPLTQDETVARINLEKIAQLKPIFREDGTVTAATSSSIADGAAAVVLMSGEAAKRQKLKPLARITAYGGHAQEPQWFTTAPIEAMRKVAKMMNCGMEQIDLFEINEAFAVVTMAAMRDLKIPHTKVNVWGGACALGHPIGASGARIVVTLLHALRHHGLHKGMASLCVGGGEAVALGLELL
ncbi:MAG: acetyl-CoA C-acyltransferase [Alphaproteobacteria bacterium]